MNSIVTIIILFMSTNSKQLIKNNEKGNNNKMNITNKQTRMQQQTSQMITCNLLSYGGSSSELFYAQAWKCLVSVQRITEHHRTSVNVKNGQKIVDN